MKKIKFFIVIFSLAICFPSYLLADEAENLIDIIPNLGKSNNHSDNTALSPEAKIIFDKIYKNQQKKQKKARQKLKINRANETNNKLRDYDTVKGEAAFAIEIKKPSKKLEKKQQLYSKAYHATLAGQYEIAVIIYEDLLQKNYRDEYALVGLASAYHRLEDVNLARKFYIKAIELYPNNMVAVNNFLILMGQEAPQESLKELLKLDQLFVANHILKAQISYLYAQQNNYILALEYIDSALNINKNNATYLYNKALILEYDKQFLSAKKIYNNILQQESFNIRGVSKEMIKKRIKNMRI